MRGESERDRGIKYKESILHIGGESIPDITLDIFNLISGSIVLDEPLQVFNTGDCINNDNNTVIMQPLSLLFSFFPQSCFLKMIRMYIVAAIRTFKNNNNICEINSHVRIYLEQNFIT